MTQKIYKTTTHGNCSNGETTKEYKAWLNMRSYAKVNNITVYYKWLRSFENFLKDVGQAPKENYVFGRLDTTKNFQPNNVQWISRYERTRTRKNNRLVEYRGETKPLVVWCEIFDRDYRTTVARIDQLGWSIEKVLQTTTTRGFKSRGKN